MDKELFIALCVLWVSTTCALIVFLNMWFFNEGEAFHPHSIDVDHRHKLFVVVGSTTECKHDFAVKSISAFVAPRGSSSSKQFTVLCVMIAVAGFLGTSRWHAVGDASFFQATLAFLGFAALLLVAGFELDVAPERFLEDKLFVTGWLIEKLKCDKKLPFQLHPENPDFRNFVLRSKHISYLYDEAKYISSRKRVHKKWNYDVLWSSMHVMGAITFIVLTTTAILLNDMTEEKVAWITGAHFVFFSLLGYLTGSYLPVLKPFKCWILLWNPFLREPHFMAKLKLSIDEYTYSLENVDSLDTFDENNNYSSKSKKGKRNKPKKTQHK